MAYAEKIGTNFRNVSHMKMTAAEIGEINDAFFWRKGQMLGQTEQGMSDIFSLQWLICSGFQYQVLVASYYWNRTMLWKRL